MNLNNQQKNYKKYYKNYKNIQHNYQNQINMFNNVGYQHQEKYFHINILFQKIKYKYKIIY